MLDVALVTLGSPDQLTGGYLYHRRLAEAASRHNARIEFVSAGVVGRPFRRRADPDVVVVDSIAAWLVHLRRPYRPQGVAVVASVHQVPGGIDHGRLRGALQAPLDRALYRRCRVIVAASQALADELVESHGLDRRRVVVVAPGSDVAPRPDEVPDLGRGATVFVSVGNWMRRKGTLELINAFARLRDHDAVLHLAGRTDIEPRYTRQVRARLAATGLGSRVVVHGAISVNDVARLYAAADVFVLPSYREPYGTVYGEALAAGLPLVGWRAGNLPHLIENGVEGILVEPGDIEGLASALRLLAADPVRRERMATAALARGQSLPTWDDSAAAFFATLRQSLSIRA